MKCPQWLWDLREEVQGSGEFHDFMSVDTVPDFTIGKARELVAYLKWLEWEKDRA